MAKFLALVAVVVVLFALVVTATGYMGGTCNGVNNIVGHATECAYRLVAGAKGNGAEGFAIAMLTVAIKKALRKGKLHKSVQTHVRIAVSQYGFMQTWIGLAENAERVALKWMDLNGNYVANYQDGLRCAQNCLNTAIGYEESLYKSIAEVYRLLGEPACLPGCMQECAEDCPLRSRNNPF